ncbi:DUF2125 domain-containing protein [Bartonella sp. CB189]|uniref:DUF2125 domain-containing protein n=1 Tax=Bartonella sp. CB189 TaxID=3112254 RepID=UPI002F96CC20
MTVVCEDTRKNGYPLRIGIVCDKLWFSWPSRDLSLLTESFTVSAPIYAPHLLEVGVHSPALIVLSRRAPLVSHWRNFMIKREPYWKTGQSFTLMVEGLEVSTIFPFDKNQKFKGELRSQVTDNKNILLETVKNQETLKDINDIIARPLDQKHETKKITAEFVQLDLKHEKSNLLGHINFNSFDFSALVSSHFVDFPKIDGSLKWILRDVPHSFDIKNKSVRSLKRNLYGKSGILKFGKIAFHTGGVLHISGPFSFDDKGYLTAKLKLTFSQTAELLSNLQRLFPEQANNLQALFFILGAVPKNADGQPSLSLKITHGWVKLEFFTLGRLAPL